MGWCFHPASNGNHRLERHTGTIAWVSGPTFPWRHQPLSSYLHGSASTSAASFTRPSCAQGNTFCPLHCCVVILCNSLCQLLIELCKLLNSRAVPLIEECFYHVMIILQTFLLHMVAILVKNLEERRCLYVEVQPECLHFPYNVVQCGWLTWRTFSTIKHTSKVSNSISCQICSAFCMCIRYFHSICVHQCQKSDYLDMTHENTLLLTIGSTSNFRIPSTYCKTLKIIPGRVLYCNILPFPSSSLQRSGSCCTWKNPTGTRLLHSPTDQNWACSWSRRASREDEQMNWNSRQRVKQYSCLLAVQRAVAFFLILSNHFSSVISCQQLHGKCHHVYIFIYGEVTVREKAL